jgi:hypothetical protein
MLRRYFAEAACGTKNSQGVLSCLLGRIRGCPEEGTELLKAIINICHHVSAARVPVAEWLNSVFKGGSFAVPVCDGGIYFDYLLNI